jgi:hypothetical protein
MLNLLLIRWLQFALSVFLTAGALCLFIIVQVCSYDFLCKGAQLFFLSGGAADTSVPYGLSRVTGLERRSAGDTLHAALVCRVGFSLR